MIEKELLKPFTPGQTRPTKAELYEQAERHLDKI
jgi:hypothetical protein